MRAAFGPGRWRANAAYRAVPWNRLGAEAGQATPPDEDSFGLLLPGDGQDLPPVAIDRDTALLFLCLREEGPPPDFVFAGGEAEAERVLHRLLFDSVLELDHGGRFVTGPAACETLAMDNEASQRQPASLVLDALSYGAALSSAPAAVLAQKLYGYNRRPATPALRRRMPDRASALAFLGLHDGGPVLASIARFWTRSDDTSPWLVFLPRQVAPQPSGQQCKLYVGLAFEELPDCLPQVARELARHRALQFKIGTDLDGLLRPDKLVAYFASQEALQAAAQALLPVVEGRRVHAVPFTAEIAGDGRLTWGMDPSDSWLGDRVSWRQFVCERLAAALGAVRAAGAEGTTTWRLALQRLALEGVDGDSFMPTGAWSGSA